MALPSQANADEKTATSRRIGITLLLRLEGWQHRSIDHIGGNFSPSFSPPSPPAAVILESC
jgi:hypothetical protein